MAKKGLQMNPDCPYCGYKLTLGKMSAWKCRGCNRFVENGDIDEDYRDEKEIIEEWLEEKEG